MKQRLQTVILQATALSLVTTVGVVLGFGFVEPQVATAVEDQFTVKQTVTSEISIETPANDVTLTPSIPGLTGGTADGNTSIVVKTNDTAGYTMTLKASGSPAMQGDTTSGTIADYTPGTGTVPDYSFSVPANSGEFGYTVSASTTSDLDQSFLDNGTDSCNTGSNDTNGKATCWLNASTTDETIVNRSSETGAGGATTTLYFRVKITSDPNPAIPEDTYTATTTLTATTN